MMVTIGRLGCPQGIGHGEISLSVGSGVVFGENGYPNLMSNLTTNHQVNMWEDKLFQGCHPDVYGWNKVWEKGIDVVIDVDGYEPVNPNLIPSGYIVLHWNIVDGDLPDIKTFAEIVRFGHGMIEKGKKVLVHCAAGQNRSALVAAGILCRLSGMSGVDCYNWIKQRNPMAFTNPVFKNWVLGGFVPPQSEFYK